MATTKPRDALSSVRVAPPRSESGAAPEAASEGVLENVENTEEMPASVVVPTTPEEELARRTALRQERAKVVVEEPVVANLGASYICQTSQTVSIRGSIVKLKPGTILSDAKFGPGVVQNLRDAGVRMKLVES